MLRTTSLEILQKAYDNLEPSDSDIDSCLVLEQAYCDNLAKGMDEDEAYKKAIEYCEWLGR